VRSMWYPDPESTEMHRLRSTAIELHAQLTAQQSTSTGTLSVDEVRREDWERFKPMIVGVCLPLARRHLPMLAFLSHFFKNRFTS